MNRTSVCFLGLVALLFFLLYVLPGLLSLGFGYVRGEQELQVIGWSKTYGGTESDFASSVIWTSDGGYALAGRTESFGAGGADAWVVKTNPSGDLQWNRTYGGTFDDGMFSLIQTNDDSYVLTGFAHSSGAGSADCWLIKTDVVGNVQWNRTFGGAKDDWMSSVIQTNDDGYVLGGLTESFGAGGADVWLVKTDSNGIIPEFPSFLILPLFMTVTLVAILCAKKISARFLRKSNRES